MASFGHNIEKFPTRKIFNTAALGHVVFSFVPSKPVPCVPLNYPLPQSKLCLVSFKRIFHQLSLVPAYCFDSPQRIPLSAFFGTFYYSSSTRSFTRQSSRAPSYTPRHNSSLVLLVPRESSETTCEGCRELCSATQNCGCHV